MRAYLIDEIDPSDTVKIKGYLNDVAMASGLEKVYWLRIPESLLSETQMNHRDCASPTCSLWNLGKTR